jgi:hypothetical protein
MSIKLRRIEYRQINSRQKENYNFLKLSAVLADYGFMTIRLSADWQGADFIAQHVDGSTFLQVQLKGRLTIGEKYRKKDLYVAFPHDADWYLYPHDKLLGRVLAETGVRHTDSWRTKKGYSWPALSQQMLRLLQPYKICGDTSGME